MTVCHGSDLQTAANPSTLIKMMPTVQSKSAFFIAVVVLGFTCSFIAYFVYTDSPSSISPSACADVEYQEEARAGSDEEEEEEEEEAVDATGPQKPIVLLWFWPIGVKFDLGSCPSLFNIDGCFLTANRSLYSQARGVIFYHKNIDYSLENLPKEPRPARQKWIWFHVESSKNIGRKRGLENLFNLTLSYRRDADITVRNELLIRRTEADEEFVLPKKDKLVCWIVSNKNRRTGVKTRENYVRNLDKFIKIHYFGAAHAGRRLSYDEYYPTIGSCKFYLAFENSVARDYITEKVNGPMVAGTVPVVLGPPRQNYEQFLPADAFIHVHDFRSPQAVAEHLRRLDGDEEAYMRYFEWRKHFKATPHLLSTQKEFIQPVCLACDHMSRDNTYSVVHDLYHWYQT